jgi:hypothetical protein
MTSYYSKPFMKHDDYMTPKYAWENIKDTDDPLQIIIPRKRIHFEKHIDGKAVENWKPKTSFDCFYYCYKMNLPRDIIWLET